MTRPLHVLMVAPRFVPEVGGLETHVYEVATGLVNRGHRVTLATQAPPAVIARDGRLERSGRLVVHRFRLPIPSLPDVPAPGLVAALPALARTADVVHAHGYHALPALASMLSAGRTPGVLTLHYHGTGHTALRARLHTLYRPVGAAMVHRAAALIAVSQAERTLIGQHFGDVAFQRAVVIPNGVRSDPAARPYATSGSVVLTIGRLERYKRVDLLIRAMALLPTEARLVVVGDGPARPDLTKLADALALSERVTFLGRVDASELSRWRATASVFATASAHEAFGITFAEALAAGLPAVASDLPSHRELAGSAQHARIVPGAVTASTAGAAESESAVVRSFAAALHPFLKERRPTRQPQHRFSSWSEAVDAVDGVYQRLVGAQGA